jgi:hypothetical protein
MVDIGDALSKANAKYLEGTGQLRKDIQEMSREFNGLDLEAIHKNPQNNKGQFNIVSDGRGNIDPFDAQGYATVETAQMASNLKTLSENALMNGKPTNAKILGKAAEFVKAVTSGDTYTDWAEGKPVTQRGEFLEGAKRNLSEARRLLNELKGMMPKYGG